MGPPQASGKAFLGLVKHVKTAFGPQALARVVAAADPEGHTFGQRIHPLAWYSYESFVAFLHALVEKLGGGNGEFCRDLGAVAGERDLGTIFKLLRRLSSPERLIRSCGRVWESYYRNAGAMEAVAWRPESTVLRIVGFESMHPLHCRLMEGWMLQTMDIVGVKVLPGACEQLCTSRGDPHHEFRCAWQSR